MPCQVLGLWPVRTWQSPVWPGQQAGELERRQGRTPRPGQARKGRLRKRPGPQWPAGAWLDPEGPGSVGGFHGEEQDQIHSQTDPSHTHTSMQRQVWKVLGPSI